jgi:hypothetical protein
VEKRPKRDVTWAGFWPAYEGEAAPSGGRCSEMSMELCARGVVSPLDMGRGSMSCGRAAPWCNGLKLEMVEEIPGLCAVFLDAC